MGTGSRENFQPFAVSGTVVLVAAFISMVLGFGREATLAAFFGTTEVTDAYLIAFIMPGMLFGLIAAALQTVFIPLYTEKMHEEGRQAANTFASTVLNVAICFIVIPLVIVIWIGAEPIIRILAPGFDPHVQGLSAQLMRYMVFAMVFMALAQWATGYLHANQRFTVPALTGMAYNIVMIVAIVLSGMYFGIVGVAIGAVGAVLVQFIVQWGPVHSQGFAWRPSFELSESLKQLARMMLPVVLGKGASHLNIMVDRWLASGLAAGSISALNFGKKIARLPESLLGRAVITVLYPTLSEEGLGPDKQRFRNLVRRGLAVISYVSVPLVATLMVLHEDITSLLLERGVFDREATDMTAYALFFYAVGVVGYSWSRFLEKTFFALHDTATPMYVGLCSVALNVLLNFLFIRYLAHGGLALATSIAALTAAAAQLWLLRNKLDYLGGKQLARSMLKSLVAVLPAAVIMVWLRNVLLSNDSFHALTYIRVNVQHYSSEAMSHIWERWGLIGDLMIISLVSIAGAIVYIVLSWLLGMDELKFVWNKGKQLRRYLMDLRMT